MKQKYSLVMCTVHVTFCRTKRNGTRVGFSQILYINIYIYIFKSNPIQKIKKWNQFGLNTVHLCMFNGWLIPVHFTKKYK